MKISYELTQKDVIKFQRSLLKNQKNLFFQSLFPYFCLGIFIGIYSEEATSSIWLEAIVLGIVIFLVSLIISLTIALLNINSFVKQNSKKLGLGKHIIEINNEGFKEQNLTGHLFTQWSGLDRIEKNKQYYYVFVNPLMAHIIPIRAFASQDEATQFYLQVQKYLNEQK